MNPEEISIRAVAFANSIRSGRITLEKVTANVTRWSTMANPLATPAESTEILRIVRELLAK